MQTFIDLVQRHEQAFYLFVHKVHSKGEGLFDSLMKWIELFLTSYREGLREKISLDFILPHSGLERNQVLKEVDEVARYHYKLKLVHEDKVRRRFGRRSEETETEADAEDAATQQMLENLMQDLSVGDLLQSDAQDVGLDGEDLDMEDDSSEYETATSSGGSDDDSSSDDSEEKNQRAPKVPPKAIQQSRSESLAYSPRSPAKTHHSPSQLQSTHGRDRVGSTGEVRQLPTRTRTRSLGALKSVLTTKISPPPLPSLPPKSSHNKPLPSSPMTANRSSMDSRMGGPSKKLQTPQLRPRKAKGTSTAIKPPELQHIPNLLPVFVEIVSLPLSATKEFDY